MFTERLALKIRLEQMIDAEERIIRELQKERAYIFSRLRELDEQEGKREVTDSTELKYLETTNPYIEGPPNHMNGESTQLKTRKKRPSRRSKTTKMRDTAINILKEQTIPIRGVDLQRLIEERTEFKIANMTTFMKTIEKADDRILKIGRGLYMYQNKQSDPILMGMESASAQDNENDAKLY